MAGAPLVVFSRNTCRVQVAGAGRVKPALASDRRT